MSVSMVDNAVDAFIGRVGASSKPFSIKTPDGKVRTVGDGEPGEPQKFTMASRN